MGGEFRDAFFDIKHKSLWQTIWNEGGGRRGIRTPGTVSGSAVFKTAAFDHSAILPEKHETNAWEFFFKNRMI